MLDSASLMFSSPSRTLDSFDDLLTELNPY